MFCPNCRRELPEGTRFCGGCGTRVEAPAQQPVPQPVPEPVPQPVQFTEVVFDQPAQPVQPVEPENKANKPQPLDALKGLVKKIPAKALKIGGIVAAVLVVAIVLVCVLSGGKAGSGNGSGQPDGALYLKDSELYFSDFSKKAPYEITGDLLDDASNSELYSYAYEIANSIHVTADGKTMFYMDKLSDDGTGTLYYRSLTNFGREAEKISGGVSRYTVSENGKLVTYLKNGTLYQFDMKDEIKLEKNVSTYRVSSDGKIIYYRNTDGAWYVMKNGEDEKIGSDISIEYITEDYATVYYLNGDKLYKKTIGKDKEKLLSGVYEITNISEDGTFYYTKLEETPMSNFFREDTDEYDGLMETLAEEVLEFYEIGYYDGKSETVIGENCSDLDSASYDGGVVVFYSKYDASGVSTITLTELVEYYYDSSYYYVVDAAQEMISNQLLETEVAYIAINGTASVLDVENLYDVTLSRDGKTMYALGDVEEGEGTLYKITISGDKIKTVEDADDDVYTSRGCYYASCYGEEYSSFFVYFKDVKDDEGDLYVNGELVDSDVYVRSTVRYLSKDNGLVYYTDYDYDKGVGTLKVWNGKESVEVYDAVSGYSITDSGNILVSYDEEEYTFTLAVWNGKTLTEITDEAYTVDELENGDILVGTDYSSKNDCCTLNLWNGKALTEISEDVYDYTVMPDGGILYLYDYSTSKYEGELYRWTGKKAVMVDEDVVALIELPGTVTHYFD